MSGLVAFLGIQRPAEALARAITAMDDRGRETRQALTTPQALLAATVSDWQEALNGGSVGRYHDIHVIADATLYYREQLVAALTSAGVSPAGPGAADLIAAAVAAWDEDAPAHLEGDFAYIAFRPAEQRGHAARDPVGTRPLFYTEATGGIAFASSPRALVASGAASAKVSAVYLAELCAGTVNVGSETSFEDVRSLRQGERVVFERGRRTRTDAWWEPPMFTERGNTNTTFADAANELRGLLVDAVRERLDGDRTTFVSLSGGRDSTAVYAAATRIKGDGVRSVSLSYPPGDAGREDETILEVLGRCGGSPTWINTSTVPVLNRVLSDSATRPDAFVHPYQGTSSAIADLVGSTGSRVVLNGLGGDTLFHAEFSFLSDLVVRGHWGTFAREWKKNGGGYHPRLFFRWGILPQLGLSSRRMLGFLRGGRRVHDVLDPPLPSWIPGRYGRLISDRAWSEPVRRLRRRQAADRERREMIQGPFAGRIIPEYFRISLSRGVEQRSPLYDQRLVRFAATRPREERRTGWDYKRLLRRAMEGWLPESVTGPRTTATGFAGSYLTRALAVELPQVVKGFGDTLRTADLGLILASTFRTEVDRFAREGSHPMLPALAFTALTEHWLREL
jgi:asparagine synthase (glutamine-hydrolysing)